MREPAVLWLLRDQHVLTIVVELAFTVTGVVGCAHLWRGSPRSTWRAIARAVAIPLAFFLVMLALIAIPGAVVRSDDEGVSQDLARAAAGFVVGGLLAAVPIGLLRGASLDSWSPGGRRFPLVASPARFALLSAVAWIASVAVAMSLSVTVENVMFGLRLDDLLGATSIARGSAPTELLLMSAAPLAAVVANWMWEVESRRGTWMWAGMLGTILLAASLAFTGTEYHAGDAIGFLLVPVCWTLFETVLLGLASPAEPATFGRGEQMVFIFATLASVPMLSLAAVLTVGRLGVSVSAGSVFMAMLLMPYAIGFVGVLIALAAVLPGIGPTRKAQLVGLGAWNVVASALLLGAMSHVFG